VFMARQKLTVATTESLKVAAARSCPAGI